MKKVLLLGILAIFYAFQVKENPPFEQEAAERFHNIFQIMPREKVYLHTDKDIYYAGENIWFRAFQVNTKNNQPEIISRILYVELTDKRDSVFKRLKFIEWDSAIFGNIQLPEAMIQGEYCIRAFTYWMQNDSADFFFKKNIRILNPYEARVNTNVKYIKDKDGRLRAEIKLTNATNAPYIKEQFKYTISNANKKEKMLIRRTDDKGILHIELRPGDHTIHLTTKDNSSIELDRYLFIPKEATDFDLQFFPEGGNLLTANNQLIAFKAIDSNGLSTEIEGTVFADSIPLVNIRSEHKGMGSFNLPIHADKRYHVEVTNNKGITKSFSLPTATDKGLGIQLTRQDSIIRYKITRGENTLLPSNLILLLQSGGQLINIVPVDQQHLNGKIISNTMPEGIIHAVLIDDAYNIYSQRLFFARSEKPANVEINTDKEKYFRREKVNLGLLLDTIENKASLSMAVVPDSDLDTTSYKDNIRSYLLMTSDLKGYIEEPAYYFSDTTRAIARHLDLVMLTHGWTRFNIADMAKKQPDNMKFYLERGQSISGKVQNFWNKDVKEADLLFLSDKGDISMTKTDSSGRFCNDQLLFADGTKFVVRATNQKGKNRVLIQFDKEQFLPVKNYFPYNEEIRMEEEDFYKNAYQNFYYENGEKVYMLNEVKVIRRLSPKKYSRYDNWVDDFNRLDSAMIANDPEENLLKLIAGKIPGLIYYNGEVAEINEPREPIPFAVNGFSDKSTFVKMIPKRFVLGASFLTGPIAQFFNAKKIILLTVQPNYHYEKPSTHMNINRISPQGLQIPDEFYIPKYEVDSVRNNPEKDERNTIFWKPIINIEPGKKEKLSFYTGDKIGTYSIIIEGVSKNGKIIRKIKKIRLE